MIFQTEFIKNIKFDLLAKCKIHVTLYPVYIKVLRYVHDEKIF